MYYNWLDRWDEQRAKSGEEDKKASAVLLDTQRAFSHAENTTSIEQFCALAEQAKAEHSFFDEPHGFDGEFVSNDNWVKFRSSVVTDIVENNVVWGKITRSSTRGRALVVFHHWNAKSWQRQLAAYFSWRGITVVEIALPYHFQRKRPGSTYADYMLSPNLGRTIQSMRQGVLDGRALVRWLKTQGYGEVSVLGMSLGSWVAGLVAAHDPTVTKASLFLTAGSLADMVWTGRATRLIRQSLEPKIGLPDLNRAWSPVNLASYAETLARPDLDLQIVLGTRDMVILPELSNSFIDSLRSVGGAPEILKLNCGHYSLALPPHIIFAGLGLDRLLNR